MPALNRNAIVNAIVEPLIAAGFEKRQRTTDFRGWSAKSGKVASWGSTYTRQINDEVLGVFIADGSSRSGTVEFMPRFGVRHEGLMQFIESLRFNIYYGRLLFKPWLTESRQYIVEGLRREFGMNMAGGWRFNSTKDVTRMVPMARKCMERNVIPYMNKRQTLQDIFNSVRKPKNSGYHSESYYIIPAALHLLGRSDEAIDWIEDALREDEDEPVRYEELQFVKGSRKYAHLLLRRMQADGWKPPKRRLKALEALLNKKTKMWRPSPDEGWERF